MCRSPPSYAEEPALFALDCEMCATATDDKALLSLCLVDVNGEIVLQVRCLDEVAAPGGLLLLSPCGRTCLSPYLVNQHVCLPCESHAVCCCLQRLVRPAEPVTDFRTAVTGRTAADLEAVDYSREDAQRDVLSLLQGVPVLLLPHVQSPCRGTPQAACQAIAMGCLDCRPAKLIVHHMCRAGARAVLVGHAVHHDLRALRLDYQPVIDTSLLLAYRHGQLCASGHVAAAEWQPSSAWRNLASCVPSIVSCPFFDELSGLMAQGPARMHACAE